MISYREVKEICNPPDKREVDPLLVTLVYRRLSLPVTWLLVHTSIRANTVTFVQLLIGLAGCILIALAPPEWAPAGLLAGVILLQISYVLDCVDGELARFRGEHSVNGMFLDKYSHAVLIPLIFVCVGMFFARHTASGNVMHGLILFSAAAGLAAYSLAFRTLAVSVMSLLTMGRLSQFNYDILAAKRSALTPGSSPGSTGEASSPASPEDAPGDSIAESLNADDVAVRSQRRVGMIRRVVHSLRDVLLRFRLFERLYFSTKNWLNTSGKENPSLTRLLAKQVFRHLSYLTILTAMAIVLLIGRFDSAVMQGVAIVWWALCGLVIVKEIRMLTFYLSRNRIDARLRSSVAGAESLRHLVNLPAVGPDDSQSEEGAGDGRQEPPADDVGDAELQKETQPQRAGRPEMVDSRTVEPRT